MGKKQKTAKVNCPKCQTETELEVPETSCLPMYECSGCKEIINVPKDSGNCCVVCEYSEGECPMPNKHKK